MKRLLPLFAASVLITALTATVGFGGFEVIVGDVVKLTDGPGGPGGIFHVDVLGRGNIPDFDTYCVELDEFISFNTEYYVAAVGLVTQQAGRTLQSQAAWLFTRFDEQDASSTGLTGFNFASPTTNQANALQLGIWRGMNPAWTDTDIINLTSWSTTYIGTLSTILGGWLTNFTNDTEWTGTGDVQVMSLRKFSVSPSGPITLPDGRRIELKEDAQDQLALIPGLSQEEIVPELPSFYMAGSVLGCVMVVGLLTSQRKRRLAHT